MRMIVLAAAAGMLASCTTAETNAGAGQQQASDTPMTQREAPTPPALRTPRQRSGTGWPNIGYRPHGY